MIQIYGTFGPACAAEQTIEAMFHAGMTGMRLNLSHTGLKESAHMVDSFHRAARKVGVEPKLLIDMQGPELRIGVLETPVELTQGGTALLGLGGIPVPKQVLPVCSAGDELLLDDGKISLKVTENRGDSLLCRVQRGGLLTGRKSLKLKNPDVHLDMPVLTEHDLRNLRLAKQYGVTGLMQPFVHSGEQLRKVRQALKDCGAGSLQIFAKVETVEGVRNLTDILPYADELIIARGDLGNDLPLWELPGVQKYIAAKCRRNGIPFMVVTQMLDSMEHSAVPTRAEVSDIFNAVTDGASSVMVTGETAVGEYPVEAIRYLSNTARSALEWRRGFLAEN